VYLYCYKHASETETELYYESPSVKEPSQDAPLQSKGELTIGYGDGGGSPWRHVVNSPIKMSKGVLYDEKDLEVEFFKLVLTTQPITLKFMEQRSPFSTDHPYQRDAEEPAHIWAAKLITVTTKKA
jgi:hypothetical protein